ncbi:MAG: GDSL-type esterase/lipase family protein [Pirellula sp.]|jgi:hypothetical protein
MNRNKLQLHGWCLGWLVTMAFLESGIATAQDTASSKTSPSVPSRADVEDVDAFLAPYRELATEWENDVAKISANNASEGSDEHVLFIGSSSFRLWDSIAEDMSPVRVVRRAFGGAKYRDLAIYAPECVRGLKFGRAMIFLGNDIRGKEDDNDPDTVARFARIVIATLRREQPDVKIYLVAVTPTESRWKHWPLIQQVNQRLQSIAESEPGVMFVSTADAYLNADGKPRAELFKDDRLHLNADGYRIWAAILKQALARAE